jgi:uncharacterized protein (DUF58 family)
MRPWNQGEWWAVAAGAVLAGVGWGVHATLLALAGVLVALGALLLWAWQRYCLDGVSYRRSLDRNRADFGEHIGMTLELVNDKVLPLTWLHVRDEAPGALGIEGAVGIDGSPWRRAVQLLVPLLPYQRLRRRLTVVCDQRGEHVFGPARLRSGDPLGIHERYATVRETERLLVYPKVFALSSVPASSWVPLGDTRAAPWLMTDPSRMAGVRPYLAGDPLRHVDWRATARSTTLLVRTFEPSASLRVAVFLDLRPPPGLDDEQRIEVQELLIALAASAVSHLATRGVAVGLYASGSVGGAPVARQPSTAPDALPVLLELLARLTRSGPMSAAELMVAEARRLRAGTSALLVGADFAEAGAVALAELRRRAAVSALWLSTEEGRPPPDELLDRRGEVAYVEDWRTRGALDVLV